MNDGLALSEITVADLLRSTPQAARLFIERGTACAGCLLARFCALKDVVETYRLDEEEFKEALAKMTVQISL